jgi:hypothetical protein
MQIEYNEIKKKVRSSESSGMYCRVINWISTDVSEVRAASEISVDMQLITRQYIPEDSELHTRRRENLKSHIKKVHFSLPLSCVNGF